MRKVGKICETEHHKKPVVKHLDNNKINNIVTNLAWDTNGNNMTEAFKDDLIPYMKGSLNGRAKLTEDVVARICEDYENGLMPKEIISKYGISRQQATKIRAGFAWLHISKNYNIPLVQAKISNDQSKDVGSSDPKRETSKHVMV